MERLRDALWNLARTARWFSGRSRDGSPAAVEVTPWFLRPSADCPGLRSALLTVAHTDGSTELYHIPLACYRPGIVAAPLAHVTWDSNRWDVVEAVNNEGGQMALLECLRHAAPGFTAVRSIPDCLRGWRYPGEQTNTSVFYGTDAQPLLVAKVFRRLGPGPNPDIELHRVLAGSQTVPDLIGTWSWRDLDLGIVVAGLPSAHDGFVMAREAAKASRPFDTAAGELGAQLARVHRLLAERLPTAHANGSDLGRTFRARFDAAAREVPELEQFRPAVQSRYAAAADASAPTQRIHGDCHLGQALATSDGWRYVDFEGEPLKPLQERRNLDSPWRDVAGMLRSFHYAAQLGGAEPGWLETCQMAFLEAYSPSWRTDSTMLLAFETDKAVYEVLYESRNRPAFVSVPVDYLAGIES